MKKNLNPLKRESLILNAYVSICLSSVQESKASYSVIGDYHESVCGRCHPCSIIDSKGFSSFLCCREKNSKLAKQWTQMRWRERTREELWWLQRKLDEDKEIEEIKERLEMITEVSSIEEEHDCRGLLILSNSWSPHLHVETVFTHVGWNIHAMAALCTSYIEVCAVFHRRPRRWWNRILGLQWDDDRRSKGKSRNWIIHLDLSDPLTEKERWPSIATCQEVELRKERLGIVGNLEIVIPWLVHTLSWRHLLDQS